jgi:hypothetical protein
LGYRVIDPSRVACRWAEGMATRLSTYQDPEARQKAMDLVEDVGTILHALSASLTGNRPRSIA